MNTEAYIEVMSRLNDIPNSYHEELHREKAIEAVLEWVGEQGEAGECVSRTYYKVVEGRG